MEVICIKDGSTSATVEVKKTGDYSRLKRTFEKTFLVKTNGLNETWADIQTDGQLPQIGDSELGCRVRSVRLKEIQTISDGGEPCILYEVEYSYDSELPEVKNPELGEPRKPPTEWPVEVSFRTQSVTEEKQTDAITGETIRNSAGEPIPVEMEMPAVELVISRYEPFHFHAQRILQYAFRTNEVEFLGIPPHHALLRDIYASRESVLGKTYYKVTYSFLIRDDKDMPFKIEILNEGTKALDPEDGKIKTTAELLGHHCTVNLNGDGTINTTEFPVMLDVNVFRAYDFNKLNFIFPEEDLFDGEVDDPENGGNNG